MSFKQKYIHAQGPFPFHFQEERTVMFQKIINLLQEFDRNSWTVKSFNFGSMIESYKLVYGLTTLQLQTLLSLLSNIYYEQSESSVQPRLIILKLLNRLTDKQIQITSNFKISNKKSMQFLIKRIQDGTKDPLKHQDSYVQELSKFIIYFSKYGEDYTMQAMQKSIQYKNTKILALFLPSIKSQQNAQKILIQLLKDCSLRQRDLCWFYCISAIIGKYPKIDYSSYYVTLFQQVIKSFTIVLDPINNQELKKITQNDSCIGIRSILKSISALLVNILLPVSDPQANYLWNSVERLFNIIITTLDHNNQPQFIMEQLQFMRSFVKYFLMRYRKQRKMYQQKNQDFIQDFHGIVESELLVDQWMLNKFNNLWPQIIPKILFFQDTQSTSSQIIVDLAMFSPQFFMPIIFSSLSQVLHRQDLPMVSLYSTKMTILFLYDFIFNDKKQYIPQTVQLFSLLLEVVQKLGIAENLDVLELLMRGYLYVDRQTLDGARMDSMVQDTIQLIINNLQSMSISLEDSASEQSELYIDLVNIFFPFFVKLDKQVIDKFIERFKFKLLNQIPQHGQAYFQLCIILGYFDTKFTSSVFSQIYKRLITIQANPKAHPKSQYFFFNNISQSLLIKNQVHIKWYTDILQCLYQYHPKMIVQDFNRLEKVVICLFKEWDHTGFAQIALDILFNLLICLAHVHFAWDEFAKPQNDNYETMKIKWNTQESETMQLILHIYDKYFIKLIDFMKQRYSQKVSSYCSCDHELTYKTNSQSHTIHSSSLRLIDSLLIPDSSQKSQYLQQKKLIYKVLSMQYTILSALMIRAPSFQGAEKFRVGFFQHQAMKSVRKTAMNYVEWVGELMQCYSILWEPNHIKLFNYFWRESLDEVFYTAPLTSTIEKLAPYYSSQVHRKKELLRCSFLILNQAYVVFTARMQFLLQINPVAYMNHPQYLKKQLIFGLHHHFDASLHTFIPSNISIHDYHHQLMVLCHFHLNPQNPQSYSYKYLNSKQKREKQRYLIGLKMILTNIKKNQNPFNYQCCIKDQFVLETVILAVGLFKVLQNKQDKILVIDLFYLMLVFGFDTNLLGETKKADITKYFNANSSPNYQQSANNKDQAHIKEKSFSYLKNIVPVEFIRQKVNESYIATEDEISQAQLINKHSYRTPQHLSKEVIKKIQDFIKYLLQKLSSNKQLDKDSTVYCLCLIMFSKFLSLSNPLLGNVISCLIWLTKSAIIQVFDVSKTGIFHIINRFNMLKKESRRIPNSPIRRPFQEFLIYRYLGGEPSHSNDFSYYNNINLERSDNYFYPSKELFFVQYTCLGDDLNSQCIQNQKVLLRWLTSHQELKQFVIACSHDKDLKDTQEIDLAMFDQKSSTGILANGHKLLNYVLDSNPKKNDIFAPFIENFSLYPLNFYPRMLKKLIRMGNQETIKNLIQIAQQLRLSTQTEQKRMSMYISAQLLAVLQLQSSFSIEFINYLAVCSNEMFDFSTQCLFQIFMKNPFSSRLLYNSFINRFRQQKGSSRLRHLTLTNIFIVAQGRFSRNIAKQSIQHLLNGVDQGSNQVSDVIVSMIVSCFVIAINLKEIGEWVQQGVGTLIRQKHIYRLNQYVGYQIDDSLKKILTQIVDKTKVQENMQSKNLKIYSKIANRVLSSISVYRYTDSFYSILKDLILYVVQKVPQQGQTDQQIIVQLKDSEYPQNIYLDLVQNLKTMIQNPPSVIKKKLKYIQSLVINYCYSSNKLNIPQQLLSINQKVISLEFIISISNIYRLMTRTQLNQKVQQQMSKRSCDKRIFKLMALLLSAGVREYQWKVDVLKEILTHKRTKIVKEFISYWWKGKNPQTNEQKQLHYLVQGVQNPYSYFA